MAFTGQAEENLQPLKRIQHELEIYETQHTNIVISQFRWRNNLADHIRQLLAD
jgi:hypothetical protein